MDNNNNNNNSSNLSNSGTTDTVISTFKEKYILGKEIGKGGYGSVYGGISKKGNEEVAIKYVQRKTVRYWEPVDGRIAPKEVCMLLECEKIEGTIKLLDWYEQPGGFIYVMERPLPCKDLWEYLNMKRFLPEDEVLRFFSQIVKVTVDLAEKGIVHRDIKGENILVLLETKTIKLIDFGAAIFSESCKYANYQGTIQFAPPEVFNDKTYLPLPACVWSLDILLHEIVTGFVPFHNEKEIRKGKVNFKLNKLMLVSDNCRDVIRQCLMYEVEKRIDLKKILSHNWCMSKCPYNLRSKVCL